MRALFLIAVLALNTRALVAQLADPAPCEPGRILDRACLLQLARGAGALALPPLASIGALGKNPDGSKIVLEDSTVVEVWVTEPPVTGALAASGAGIDSLWLADTAVAGRSEELSRALLEATRRLHQAGAPNGPGGAPTPAHPPEGAAVASRLDPELAKRLDLEAVHAAGAAVRRLHFTLHDSSGRLVEVRSVGVSS